MSLNKNLPAYPLSWESLPIGAGYDHAPVTNLAVPGASKHGAVIDVKQIGRILVASARGGVNTIQSIALNAYVRGYQIHVAAPASWRREWRTPTGMRPHPYSGYEQIVESFAVDNAGRKDIVSTARATVDERLQLLAAHGVTAWHELSEETRVEHEIKPVLVVIGSTDRDELAGKRLGRLVNQISAAESTATGVILVVAIRNAEEFTWSEDDDARTAKIVLSASGVTTGATRRLIEHLYVGVTTEEARELPHKILKDDEADLFAVGNAKPRHIHMKRTDLRYAGDALRQMGVPLRESA